MYNITPWGICRLEAMHYTFVNNHIVDVDYKSEVLFIIQKSDCKNHLNQLRFPDVCFHLFHSHQVSNGITRVRVLLFSIFISHGRTHFAICSLD